MIEYGDLNIREQKGTGKLIGYMYWYDASGKRRQISKTAKSKGKREAKKELKEWELDVRREAAKCGSLKDSDTTLRDAITMFLDEQLEHGFLEKSTHYQQLCTCNKNVFPYIGDYLFTGIDHVVIDKWLTDLAARGLKQSTIHSVYAIVNKTYHHHLFKQDIDYNPCSHVRTPKKGAKRMTFLDPDQLDNLLYCLNTDYEEGHYLWTAINLAALGGLRRGEICGLRFHDVDMDKRKIEIESAIGVTGTGTYAKGPKNESSKRVFDVPEQLMDVMKARIAYVEREYGTIDGSWFVVGDTIKYKPPTTLSKEVSRFVRRHELVDHYGNEVTLHSLRHNMATIGVKNNVDIASLSQMLGHASKSMTLDTYSHVAPQAMRMAADAMSNAFRSETMAYEMTDEAT